MKKITGIISIFILVFVLNSCLSLGDGSNTLIKVSVNDEHTKKAVLFLREAGATVANSYQVSITNYKVEFDTVAIGNVFTVDDNHGKANLNPNAINFNWISNNTIQICYDKNLRTFIKEKTIDGITVFYKAK